MEVCWLPSALADLEAARAYIAEDKPAASRRIFERILSEVTRLTSLPHIGRPGRVAGARELIVPSTPFIVPYRVHEGRVVILAVIHAARQWPERR